MSHKLNIKIYVKESIITNDNVIRSEFGYAGIGQSQQLRRRDLCIYLHGTEFKEISFHRQMLRIEQLQQRDKKSDQKLCRGKKQNTL